VSGSITAHHGDCLEVIPRLVAEGIVCDAVVTDPPYHLTATQKRFAPPNSAPAQYGRDGAMSRLSGGFMGQQWDGGDIAFRPETWATIATALRPGAFLVAFGSTRTFHRLACAIEDAGIVIQDTIAWLYGSGFPKRRDMLKPAIELIVLAYKPGGKRTLQVDECRIGTDESTLRPLGATAYQNKDWGGDRLKHPAAQESGGSPLGRWPANVCHDGSEEVTEAFAAFGESSSTAQPRHNGEFKSVAKGRDLPHTTYGHADTGSAARFFYSSKANKQDRWGSRHPTVKPAELLKWLVPLVTPPGGLVLDPFAGTGTTGVAALATGRDCILIEREAQYLADIRERLAFYEGGGGHSVQAKNRHRNTDAGPLFAPPYDPALDSALSYEAAIKAIGERVKAGEPLPTTGYFGPKRAEESAA
jgi:site-specific DNA-methyltransferase (adenine-specific)